MLLPDLPFTAHLNTVRTALQIKGRNTEAVEPVYRATSHSTKGPSSGEEQKLTSSLHDSFLTNAKPLGGVNFIYTVSKYIT